VTLVLNATFKTSYAQHLHFKGGTSLSKAWDVIERFSEDIDLSINRAFYGFSEDLSFSQIKKLKRISSEFVSAEFKAELEKTLCEMGVPAQLFTCVATPIPEIRKDTVDPQELNIEYVSILENVEYLPNTIKVEISARSIKEATEIRDVNSITEGLLPKIELLGGLFQVRTIEPQITLLEKICLLHCKRPLYNLQILLNPLRWRHTINFPESGIKNGWTSESRFSRNPLNCLT
jgi:hypothetical protein